MLIDRTESYVRNHDWKADDNADGGVGARFAERVRQRQRLALVVLYFLGPCLCTEDICVRG